MIVSTNVNYCLTTNCSTSFIVTEYGTVNLLSATVIMIGRSVHRMPSTHYYNSILTPLIQDIYVSISPETETVTRFCQ